MLLGVLVRRPRSALALALAAKMESDRIEMGTITCNAAGSACEKAKEWLLSLALVAK